MSTPETPPGVRLVVSRALVREIAAVALMVLALATLVGLAFTASWPLTLAAVVALAAGAYLGTTR